MANYKQVGYGSQGSDVTELQKLLNSNGYKLDVDGIFGSKTQAAVKDYQKKNSLAVDGIVGNNTWGALTKAATTTANNASPSNTTGQTTTKSTWSYADFKPSSATAAADKTRNELASQKPGDFSYKAYEPSDAVKQAQALLQQQLSQKPGAYQSAWQTQLNDIMSQIMNREKFSYDLNGDALYQQYKDQYVMQGQQAMMDTMGQAAALTGGYGNSYAQTAGQQTYQGYLQQLNDKVPELYQLALDKYQMEGQDLMNQYSMLGAQEEQDYGRYRDQVSDYYTELDRLTNDARYQSETDYNRYNDAYSKAYGEHRDTVSDWQYEQARADENYFNLYDRDYSQYADDRNLSYQQNRDQIGDDQWDKSFAYQQERDKKADEQWQKEFDEAKRQYDQQYALTQQKTSNPGRDTGDDDDNDTPQTGDTGISKNAIKNMQISLGVTADGVWGPESKKAAGGLSLEEAYKQWNQGKLKGASTVNEGKIKSFESKLHTENMHDAIERHKWGSYKQYVAYQIEHSGLSNVEKAYLISKYGIRESDTNYKNS